MESAVHRIPALRRPGSASSTTARRASPPTTSSCSVRPRACGASSSRRFQLRGIASAGGAGRALAEWVVEGEPTGDLLGVDLRRFAPFNGQHRWLRDRVGEVLGLHYAVPWPNRSFETARPLRRSPVHALLADAGRLFGSPRWAGSAPNCLRAARRAALLDYSWERPTGWLGRPPSRPPPASAVAVFDQTSFSKYLVSGRTPSAPLQWLCTADVAVPAVAPSTPALLNRARHLRGGPHGHAARR